MSNTTRFTTAVLIIICCVVTAVLLRGLLPLKNIFTAKDRNSVASVLEESPFFAPATPAPTPEPEPVRILFGGDMMFDRSIRVAAQRESYDFLLSELQPLFFEYDVVVANLEGPVTSFASESVGSAVGSPKNFIFTFAPEVAPLLKRHNMSIVNLGNNHILNFGQEGLRQTKEYLDAADVQYFGNAGEAEDVSRVLVTDVQGMTIGFVNYNQFIDEPLPRALRDIAAVREQVDLVIVYTHWGLEYQPEANQVIRDVATQLQAAGADLIIGSHPHVTQQFEVLVDETGRETPVYYSLGNFVFDQYFEPAVQQGLLVGVEINPVTLEMEFAEYPISLLRSGQTVLSESVSN